MRIRYLITAAAGASLIVLAVSTPSPQKSSEGTDDREISLATAPASAAPVVSALESGRPGVAVSVVARKTTVERPAAEPAAATAAAELMLEPQVAMSATVASTMPDLAPAAVPVAPSPPVTVAHVHDAVYPPEVVSAAPRIIIRGGMGSVHDDCKINLRGINTSAGAAVNRMAPAFGGYSSTGTSGGFRGGIR